jgi:hypothetical protein
MMLNRFKLRALIESVLLEGVEEDRSYLATKFPDYETEIVDLPGSAIKWLTARYGERSSGEDGFPFYRSLAAISSFVENESSLRGNASKLSGRKYPSVTDPTRMSASDIEELIKDLKSLKSSKGRSVDASRASNPENDVIGRISGWKISIPSSRENSCALGFENPKLCTTRTVGNNLWARYIHDSILFTFTREGLSGEEAHEQMFIWTFGDDCAPRYGEEGGYGAETVDGSNNNIQERDIRKRLGSHFDEIKRFLAEKCEELGGKHPAYSKVEAATQTEQGLKDLTGGVKGGDLSDMLSNVAKLQLSDEVERIIMNHPSDAARSALAASRFASITSLRHLAKDPKRLVSDAAKKNPNFPIDDLMRAAQESDDPSAWESLARSTQSLKILETIVDLRDEKYERARAAVAYRTGLPDHLIDKLKEDPSTRVRSALAGNESISLAVMRQMMGDESPDVVSSLSRNRSLPVEEAMEILNDESLDATIRLGAFGNPAIKNDIEIAKRFTRDPDPSVSLIARNMYSRLMSEKGLNERRLRQLIRRMI